jgi:hypothetical protein
MLGLSGFDSLGSRGLHIQILVKKPAILEDFHDFSSFPLGK